MYFKFKGENRKVLSVAGKDDTIKADVKYDYNTPADTYVPSGVRSINLTRVPALLNMR